MKPTILFQDQFLLILNKPSELHSVVSPKQDNPTLANWLVTHFPECAAAAPKPGDGGLVQRLDFETSGCILAAKTRTVWELLFRQLKDEQVKKEYCALIEGELTAAVEVNSYLGSPHRGAKKIKVYLRRPAKNQRALPAHTIFQPRCYQRRANATLVTVTAHRAHRHQIRAHAAHIAHPLLGDALYGSKKRLEGLFPDGTEIPAFLLHAARVAFLHPISGLPLAVEAPLPPLINAFLAG